MAVEGRLGGVRGALVLVVHEDEALRGLLAEALRLEGYRVVSGDHRDALAALRAAGVEHPAVVLLDLHGDARGFALDFRRAHGDVAIAAITTAPERRDGAEVGAAAVLPLPFELDALLACIARLCATQ